MGFFDKMFEKKECAICGTELGLLGKTKINEGYLCKECAGKLSPYFHGYRSSTGILDEVLPAFRLLKLRDIAIDFDDIQDIELRGRA